MSKAIHTTDFPDLKLWWRGKVRDLYDLGDSLLIVATDRISAYDVVMNDPIPEKGAMLTQLSLWWFEQLSDIVPNHLLSADVASFPDECQQYREELEGRSMHVHKAHPFPVECVARGYLAGSGWREYKRNGTVCGLQFPEGLNQADKLPATIFTPATKAEEGHDENISFEQAAEITGLTVAERLRELTITLYEAGARIAAEHGIIIADTKFEFGLDDSGQIMLIDEILTPDSSRFWLAEEYKPGTEPVNFDKQYLRDWLDTLDWDKTPPPPQLPDKVVQETAERYAEALRMFTGTTVLFQ
ncbi:MAG: phosphoribosylaminoimidazolesuccinocarboxamide synthase [Chlorobi bacterium]|nr:phosphoribosylaminoimidazolesuccinocarboxamide synthase [Chlorobiota bacterium]